MLPKYLSDVFPIDELLPLPICLSNPEDVLSRYEGVGTKPGGGAGWELTSNTAL